MIQPRWYQQNLINDTYHQWKYVRDVMAVLPTGGGKAYLLCFIIRDFIAKNRKVVLQVHRRELIGQLSMSLATLGIPHTFIASKATINFVVSLHMEEFGRSFYSPTSNVCVASVQTLINNKGVKNWAPNVDLKITDECFIAGTLIDGTPIENIRPGDYVTAFDDQTGVFAKKRVVRLFKNVAPLTLIKVCSKSHHELVCTSGHPFWTKNRGWVNAGELTTEDEVYVQLHVLRDRDHRNIRKPALSLPKSGTYFLLQRPRLETSSRESGLQTQDRTTGCKMLDVRKSSRLVRTPALPMEKYRESILQQGLQQKIPFSKVIRNDVTHQQKTRIETDDRKQSNEETRGAGESQQEAQRDRARSENSGWERQGTDRCRTETFRPIRGTRVRTSGHCKDKPGRAVIGLSDALQNRLRAQRINDSYRSGRFESQLASTERAGRKEGFLFDFERVESVSIVQRDDLERQPNGVFDGYVYNIEVEDFHTYVANDVVVHNCHHVLLENTWGRCWELFPNAYGLGVTATPQRTDGYGLGRHADGVFDCMVIGPTMRELIKMGNLSEYRVACPRSDINLSALQRGSGGEFTSASVEEALAGSHIVGDAVKHYNRYIPNKPGIVFASSIEKSDEIAAAFNSAGIPATSVSSKDDDITRANAMRDFRSGRLKVLCNYALYDEGVDVPGLYGVIDAAPTNSLIRFHQRFGRMLRKAEGKPFGYYIDMVSNIRVDNRGNHALPDSPMLWTLDRRKTRSSEEDENIMKLTVCLECFQPYQANDTVCPHCGAAKPVTAPRVSAGPVQIDDELIELTPERLASLRGEIDDARRDSTEWMRDNFGVSASGIIPMKQRKNHRERKEALLSLDDTIATWAGMMREFGMSDEEIHDGFRRQYGMTIYEARVLKRVDAEKLADQLNKVLQY